MLALVVSGHPAVIFIVSNPYVIPEIPFAQTILATYSTSKVSLQTAVDTLFGSVAASGKLPVQLPDDIDPQHVHLTAHD